MDVKRVFDGFLPTEPEPSKTREVPVLQGVSFGERGGTLTLDPMIKSHVLGVRHNACTSIASSQHVGADVLVVSLWVTPRVGGRPRPSG